MSADRINDLTAILIKQVGGVVGLLPYEERMVILEGVAAGLIAFTARRDNKQPDELVAAFTEGVGERVTRLIYGEKQ